jgi:hypothetical protein
LLHRELDAEQARWRQNFLEADRFLKWLVVDVFLNLEAKHYIENGDIELST